MSNPQTRNTGFSSILHYIHWQNLLAGVSGGVVSTICLHPLDLVKIRFQVNEGTGIVATRPQYQGLLHALKSIYSARGVAGLYQGVTPNMWGAGASWGFYFMFYNSIKRTMQSGDSKQQLSASQHILAACQAGAMTLSITNPIWVTKTRLCLQYERMMISGENSTGALQNTQYRGMWHALYSIAKVEGLRGLYKGFVPGLFGVSHGALQFMAYEEMKNRYNNHHNRSITTKLSTLEYLTFAALSKLFAAATTYPYQVIRSRLQDQHRKYRGVLDVISQIWRYEGIHGYYKGLLPSLLRVTPACCITFLVYENMIAYLMPP